MIDLSPVRAYVKTVAAVEIVDGEVRTSEVESSEVTSFACVDHPEHLWNSAQWKAVVEHLRTRHGDTAENGTSESPFHDPLSVTDEVQVGVEPPIDE